jgi:hypothetical protein
MSMTRVRTQKSALSAAESHVFDRARLYVDLDEATDSTCPAATLLVAGFKRRRDRQPSALTRNDVQLLDRLDALMSDYGSIYRTRAAEVCALLTLEEDELDDLTDEIERMLFEFHRKGTVGIGLVNVPGESTDAVSALALADAKLMTLGTKSPRRPAPVPARRADISGALLRWG